MKEQVNLRLGADATLADVIAKHAAQAMMEQYRIKGNGLFANVEVTIDGTPISFKQLIAAMTSEHEQQVRACAVRMVSADEGLAGLRKALLQAQLAVRAAVDALPMPAKD